MDVRELRIAEWAAGELGQYDMKAVLKHEIKHRREPSNDTGSTVDRLAATVHHSRRELHRDRTVPLGSTAALSAVIEQAL
ncbi:unnamed protein product, partial [Symbiodinium sp. CCMP2456]